jgi:Protein of unknown function (DUF2490)
MNFLKTIVLIIFFGLVFNITFAQTQSHNNNLWLHYVGKNMLNKKLSFTFESSLRFANGLSKKQQYFVRPSFDYQLNKHLVASLGYTHYNTYVYGNPALNKRPIPEDHIWVQAAFTHQFRDLKLTNRLRDENRFVGIAALKTGTTDYGISDFKYRNRFRYMLLATYPLIKKNNKPKLTGFIGDEAMLNLGRKGTDITKNNVGKTLMNQNRIIIGLGYIINPKNSVQLSFIQQKIWNFPDTIEENNATLRISYLTNLDFTKK